PVAGPGYVVAGQVRYEGVEGQGYLEMWTVFPDGQRFFSRTLAPRGPLAALPGESSWRRFELPCGLGGASQPPARAEVDLVWRGRPWLAPRRGTSGTRSWRSAGPPPSSDSCFCRPCGAALRRTSCAESTRWTPALVLRLRLARGRARGAVRGIAPSTRAAASAARSDAPPSRASARDPRGRPREGPDVAFASRA